MPSRQRKVLNATNGLSPLLPTRSTDDDSPLENVGPNVDQNLVAVTRTLSSASRRHPESPIRGGSGLVRITSPTPYHRNPNVILAQHEAEAEEGRRPREQGQLNRGSALHRSRFCFFHYLNPASWCRCFGRSRRLRQERDPEYHSPTADIDKGDEEGI